jgi:NAD(P)H-nitrite reductase large subunit
MPVTHCVCYNISFDELKGLSEREALRTLDELRERTKCCTGCGMCEPYVQLMLRTGQTRFRVLTPAGVRKITRHVDPPADPSSQPAPSPAP